MENVLPVGEAKLVEDEPSLGGVGEGSDVRIRFAGKRCCQGVAVHRMAMYS
jgi:hypothetical protein